MIFVVIALVLLTANLTSLAILVVGARADGDKHTD